jgi:hypothetical protein
MPVPGARRHGNHLDRRRLPKTWRQSLSMKTASLGQPEGVKLYRSDWVRREGMHITPTGLDAVSSVLTEEPTTQR